MTQTTIQALSLDSYRLLGRSGLRVSPLALGTMTFGEEWGADEQESRRIFDSYVDQGGNFIDTAGYYADGASETLTGKFAEAKRERLVLSTKYSLTRSVGDPNAAGNSRRNMVQTVETSLKRLKTDRIDLFFLHVWDDMTPADKILRAFDDLVTQGKILYLGLSDTPAWQMARLQTMSELRGWSQLVALQSEYNLVERTAERDLIPAAKALVSASCPGRRWRAACCRANMRLVAAPMPARLAAVAPCSKRQAASMRAWWPLRTR